MNAIKKHSRMRAIHAACRAHGIDDSERKRLQVQITGKASLTEMQLPDLDDVLNHLNRIGRGIQGIPSGDAGHKQPNPWAFVFRLTPERQKMAKKVFRLAEKLGAAQTPPVGVMSVEYIEGIARQMRGCDMPLAFCDANQLLKIVQALEIHLKRIGSHDA